MDNLNIVEHTASEARKNLFDLIRTAGTGAVAHQINLRDGRSVVMISKKELDDWMETFDVMSSPEEMEAIREAKKERRGISHEELLKKLGIKDED